MSLRRALKPSLGLLAVLACVATLAVACGDDDAEPTSTTASSTTEAPGGTSEPAETVTVQAFFGRGEKIAVAAAQVEGPATARGAVEAVLAGPDEASAASGMASEVPEGTELLDLAVSDGVAVVDLSSEFVSGGGSLSMQLRAAQIVFTLTQFDTVDTVTFRIDGEEVDGLGGEGIPAVEVDRAEFENVTPLVLITSPLPGEVVTGPLTVSGISNTFEATVLYEVVANGTLVDEGFTTATSGMGTWGTFEFEVGIGDEPGAEITISAFQENMESGGRQDVYEVAVTAAG